MWQPHAKAEFHLGSGGIPPTLEELGANPRQYFRNDITFSAFVKGMGAGSVSELQNLLTSERIRLKACSGEIKTTGQRLDGTIGWNTRPCYEHEMLIEQLRPSGTWEVDASTACLNLAKEVDSTNTPSETGVPHRMIDSNMLPPVRGGYILYLHLPQRCKRC
jgi:hypothetical protein